MQLARKLWQLGRDALPVSGFHFDRPLVLFQSDDWGRVGLRDQAGLEQLRSAGIELGERPYDFYSLETGDDLSALMALLQRHHDSEGMPPCLQMNFVVANLDCVQTLSDSSAKLHFNLLANGLPSGWERSNLIETYRTGIDAGLFYPALHGSSHFCRRAVERNLQHESNRSQLLRTLWQAGTPYIHWRMPWIGYEYWDPEQLEDERFLPAEKQRELIGYSVGAFAKLFSKLPRSACAPGYRANEDTNKAWAQHGIGVAQSGPGTLTPPHFDGNEMLHLSRNLEFEAALHPDLSVDVLVQQAERCFERGIPVIVSTHSINFHSTVRDFRSPTIQLLDQFLTALESRHSDLLYLHDENLYDLINQGSYRAQHKSVQVKVMRKNFTRAGVRQEQMIG